jgi:hypothetical protein
MLVLDDAQMEQVKAAARPLPYRLRDPFLRAVSKALDGQHPIGMASLQRAASSASSTSWAARDGS